MEFLEREYRAAKKAATSIANHNNGYVEAGDVLGGIYEWMVSNYDKVVEMREEKPAYFNASAWRAGARYVHEERKRRTGAHDEDLAYYSTGLIDELLDYVWGEDAESVEVNTRFIMMVDVRSAMSDLTDDERVLLVMRHKDQLDFPIIGQYFEMTEDGVRKWHLRVLRKLNRKLGGDAPWWGGPGSRKARSNAAAQAEVRQ